jgi:hypothetical protein
MRPHERRGDDFYVRGVRGNTVILLRHEGRHGEAVKLMDELLLGHQCPRRLGDDRPPEGAATVTGSGSAEGPMWPTITGHTPLPRDEGGVPAGHRGRPELPRPVRPAAMSLSSSTPERRGAGRLTLHTVGDARSRNRSTARTRR